MQRVWQLAMLVGLLMRWVRSQGRQLELLCCLEEAARRRHLALLVLRLVRREHLRWLREWQLERPWSEVVDRLRMWVQLQLRWEPNQHPEIVPPQYALGHEIEGGMLGTSAELEALQEDISGQP